MKQKIIIPPDEGRTILKIIGRLKEKGFQCYLIGGCVRDLILGNEVYDYDMATNARPDEIMLLFKKTIPTGIKHGTVSVLLDGMSFEITTYRADGKYIDGRRPQAVSYSSSLTVDVSRRDFTINGLAYDPIGGEIIDHVNGLNDLQQGIIRTIGDPLERFSEDGLRPIRACRFAAKLNFTIDEETFAAIPKTLDVVKKVSLERVRDEFVKILECEKPSIGIENLRTSGLLDIFLPELTAGFEVSQNKYHIFDIYYHSIYSCDAAPKDDMTLRLSALLHDIGKVPSRRLGPDGDYTFYNHEVIGAKMTKRIMKRLKFSNEQIEKVNMLILNHMFHYTDEWTDGAVRRFIRKVGVENISNLFQLRLADRKGNGSRKGLPAPIEKLQERIKKVIEEENAFTVRDLDINGTLIMQELNLQPGPIIGKILNELLEMVLDNPEANREEVLIARAKEISSSLEDNR